MTIDTRVNAPDDRPDDDLKVLDLITSPITYQTYRIVLEGGRFVEAVGFEIHGSVAVPLEVTDEDLEKAGGILTLSLTWEVDR